MTKKVTIPKPDITISFGLYNGHKMGRIGLADATTFPESSCQNVDEDLLVGILTAIFGELIAISANPEPDWIDKIQYMIGKMSPGMYKKVSDEMEKRNIRIPDWYFENEDQEYEQRD